MNDDLRGRQTPVGCRFCCEYLGMASASVPELIPARHHAGLRPNGPSPTAARPPASTASADPKDLDVTGKGKLLLSPANCAEKCAQPYLLATSPTSATPEPRRRSEYAVVLAHRIEPVVRDELLKFEQIFAIKIVVFARVVCLPAYRSSAASETHMESVSTCTISPRHGIIHMLRCFQVSSGNLEQKHP